MQFKDILIVSCLLSSTLIVIVMTEGKQFCHSLDTKDSTIGFDLRWKGLTHVLSKYLKSCWSHQKLNKGMPSETSQSTSEVEKVSKTDVELPHKKTCPAKETIDFNDFLFAFLLILIPLNVFLLLNDSVTQFG